MNTNPLSRRWTFGDKLIAVFLILCIIVIFGLILSSVICAKHFTGDYFEQDANNPILYNVYLHETDNPASKYKVETTSKIYAKRLAECVNVRLSFKDAGYLVYNGVYMPYEVLVDENNRTGQE